MNSMGQSIIGRTGLALAAASLLLAPVAAAAKARDLRDLVGARAGTAEGDLESRGWVQITGHNSGGARYNYWWSASQKQCVMVTTRDGRYSAITDAANGDCNQRADNTGAKVGAAVGVAALAALLLSHKSGHHDNGQHYDDAQREADYERGYRDGLHNGAYRNGSNSDSYSQGYQNGVNQRQTELDHDNGYGNNWRGNAGTSGWGSGGGASFSDLVGAKAAGAESDLQARGFRNVDGFDSGNSKGTIWWNGRQCLQMITANGRADSITDIGTHPRCR
ncbi:hypothetical protein [Sandarakinorhabdus oryzae]|uniref:hypothetical protein n=1 Tax=Sandarakinorhabdus oryzae TaxID=2675220 RepID=UPI0012E2B83E|nr:hypothetical protein [Sandarakinorhabdus oryzae]